MSNLRDGCVRGRGETRIFHRSQSRSLRGDGFSLLEAMLAAGLIFLVLGLATLLVTDYSNMFRRTSPRDRLLEAIELGLERVCGEVSSAVTLVSPTAGSATTLAFDRIDPAATGRLPIPLPVPDPDADPPSWNDRAPADILTVDYQCVSGRLRRDTTSATSSSSDEICQGLSGFSATLVSAQSMRVTLSLEVNDRIYTLNKEATLWVDR